MRTPIECLCLKAKRIINRMRHTLGQTVSFF
jgi:hypothetical protein